MVDLPKNPKADDLVPVLTDLDGRVAALEEWRVAHSAGMSRRQRQIDQIRQAGDRERWLRRMRRGGR